MSFQQGLSGLSSSARALDVISSNVANSSTVGFKSSSTLFADTYASALSGVRSSVQVGAGSSVTAVRQSFSQGNVTSTNNALDMAINGNGFFMIERNNGTTAYSRNGQFDLDRDGYVVTPLGERLMGYQTVNPDGSVTLTGTGTPVPIYIPPQGIAPSATQGDQGASLRANLDSAAAAPATTPFDQADPDSYNFTTSMRIYDSQGNDHTLSFYFVKAAAPALNQWEVHASINGGATGTPPVQLDFGPTGRLLATSASTMAIDASFPGADLSNTTGAEDLEFTVNFAGLTQESSPFSVSELRQNGFPPGQIAGVSVSADGIIQGRYTNGQTQSLGQVVLATFRSTNGLASLGDNLWGETSESGQPAVGIPGTGLNGTLASARVEESNVDLSQELVQMIIAQRNYQANAQSIRTQDQILQTLINLR